MSHLFGPARSLTFEAGQWKGCRCAHSPLLTEIRRRLVLRGVTLAVYMYMADNPSLSNLYCPYVVPTTPKIFCSQAHATLAVTVSSALLIINLYLVGVHLCILIFL